MFIVAFSLLLAMIDVTRSDNTVYLFEPIAQANPEDEEADYKELGHFPSINDAGTVAFSATLSDDSKCIRKKDGPLPDTTVSTIAHTATSGNNNHFHCTTNGPAILFEDLCIAPAINNSGYVSFWGRSCTKRCDNATGSSCGVFLGNGANEGTDPAPINTRINCCGYNATEVMSAYPSINDFGKVAYWASYQEDGCNRRGLFVMDDKIADRDEDNEEDDYCNVGFLWFEGARIIGDANNTIQGIFWGQTSEANETYPYNYTSCPVF